MIRSIALVVVFIGTVLAHSWIACADYRITKQSDAEVFVPGNCKAYGRNWKNLGNPGTFGLDNGYDFDNNGPNCRDPLPAYPYTGGYSSLYPMAQYAPGQNVCIAWPAKNHVAATCNNPYIPDNGLNIWVSGANPTSNPTPNSLRLVKAFPKNTASNQYAGFQNCPKFCDNQDKATCTGCFTVPSDLQTGSTYTFVWAWAFNGPNQIYSNCWEAQIGAVDTNAAPPTQTSENPTSQQQQTSRPTSQQQGTSQQTSQQGTTQQPSQQPSTSTSDCLAQCVTVCGSRGVSSCNCSNGLSVECNKEGAESSSSASALAISAIALALTILF